MGPGCSHSFACDRFGAGQRGIEGDFVGGVELMPHCLEVRGRHGQEVHQRR